MSAGSGRFAYRFLKALTTNQKFVYVMTDATVDATASVVNFWRDNPPSTILQPGTLKNPAVMIGNYIFDTIPQDAYTLTSGQFFRNLVTIRAPSRTWT
jgi:hypothetical protein